MPNFAGFSRLWCVAVCVPLLALAQEHQPTPLPRQQPTEDPAAVQRGQSLFKSSCGFCHGSDATGARAPDLLRSPILMRDDRGNLLGPFIRNGRPDKGMPSFTTLKDDEVADIVAFLHHQLAASLHSNGVRRDYPVAKLLTGNAQEGKTFFYGAGGCSHCHSATGDLAGLAKKDSALELQDRMLAPSEKKAPKTAIVTLRDGQRFAGEVVHQDEFSIGIRCKDGWYRSWPMDEVRVEIQDPLAAHRELMSKYTDADIHNLFAYLESLK